MDHQAAEELFQRTLVQHQAGAIAEAMAGYQDILEQFSAPAESAEGGPGLDGNLLLANVHNNIGVLLKSRDEFREAIDHLRQALDLAPGHVDALTNLGTVYLRQRNAEGAIDLFRQALELRPEHLQARISMGDAHMALGQHEDAATAFNQAQGATSPSAALQFSLGQAIMKTGRLDAAVTAYRNAVKIDAGHVAAHVGLGKALFFTGAVDEAITVFTKAVELAPDQPEAHTNLGRCYQSQGKMQATLDAYRRALTCDPGFVDARGNLSAVLLSSGKLGEARKLLADGLKLTPDDMLLNLVSASCDRESGDAGKAVLRLETLIETLGRDRVVAEIWLELGKCYTAHGNAGKAEECAAEAERVGLSGPQKKNGEAKESG